MRFFLILLFISFAAAPLFAQKHVCKDFQFDHLVFFVNDASIEHRLDSIFTKGEKLNTVHSNQGTESHFYLFYNTFIELMYPSDSLKIKANSEAFGSDYLQRWSVDPQNCRLAIGGILNPLDSSCTNYHTYQSKDNPDFYLMALGNTNMHDVMIYASSPKYRYPIIERISDLEKHYQPPYLRDFEAYCQHPTGIKKLTQLRITGPIDQQPNFAQINTFDLIETQEGEGFVYELEFDQQRQQKHLVVNDWLIIRY